MKSLLFFLLFASPLFGQIIIIPQPAVIQPKRGEFIVRSGFSLWSSASCSTERAFLQAYWQQAGLPALTNAPKAKKANVALVVDANRTEALGLEGYELIVSAKRISITGATPKGVFYGLQTLRQVLSGSAGIPIQAIQIRDKPRFGWRSFRFDETRNLLGMVALKKLLDELALLKFNRFQWPADKTPTTVYTQQQVLEITRYAEARHIKLVPTPTTMPVFGKDESNKMLKTLNLGQSLAISIRPETELGNSLTQDSLEQLYRVEPIPDQMPEDLLPQILGVEFVCQNNQSTKSDGLPTQLYSTLAAAAEVAWTFAQHKDFARFKVGLTGLTTDRTGFPAILR